LPRNLLHPSIHPSIIIIMNSQTSGPGVTSSQIARVQDFYKSLTSLLVKGSGVWEPSPPINPELMDVLTSLRSGINGNPGSDRPREGNDDPDARVEEVSSVIHLDIIFQTPSDKSAILLTNARRQMGDGWKSLTDEDVRNLVEGQLLETVYSILKRRDDKLYLSLVSSLLEADDKVTQQASMAKPIQGDVPSDSSSAALKGSRPADPSSYAPSIEIDDTVESHFGECKQGIQRSNLQDQGSDGEGHDQQHV